MRIKFVITIRIKTEMIPVWQRTRSHRSGLRIDTSRWRKPRSYTRLLPGWTSPKRRRRMWRNRRRQRGRRWRRTPLPLVFLLTLITLGWMWFRVFLLLLFRFVLIFFLFHLMRKRKIGTKKNSKWKSVSSSYETSSYLSNERLNDYDISEKQSRKSENGS